VRVPRGALLNAYSQVDRDGSFHSPVQKPRDRFLKVLAPSPLLCQAPTAFLMAPFQTLFERRL